MKHKSICEETTDKLCRKDIAGILCFTYIDIIIICHICIEISLYSKSSMTGELCLQRDNRDWILSITPSCKRIHAYI